MVNADRDGGAGFVDESRAGGGAVLYELARNPKAAVARPEKIRRATAGETEQITAMLLDALDRSGYVNRATSASTEEKVRRLVRRMDIAGRDAPVLMGMLRQILWKLGNG